MRPLSSLTPSRDGYIDVEKRRREMEQFTNLSPRVRKLIAESPIDIDIPKMLEAFRRDNLEKRKQWVFAHDAVPPEMSPDERDDLLCQFIEAAIRQRVSREYSPIVRIDRKRVI